jgi:superfamily II DNA/RNA helicase
MMAQLESWEAAAIFDTMRETDDKNRNNWYDSIAKTLTIYSRSSAARFLEGFDKNLNQIYSAALYYLADQPATATFLARLAESDESANEEEIFLKDFFSRKFDQNNTLYQELKSALQDVSEDSFESLLENLYERVRNGLQHDPRQYFASKLAFEAIKRFSVTNVWSSLYKYASNYSYESWAPFFTSSSSSPSFPLWELLPSQIAALESGLLGDLDEPISLQMPTSSGKTALCEILIYHEVKIRNRRVLFLVPFRALAAEILAGISNRLKNAGLSVIASYGGNISTKSEKASIETADVLIVTPEKFAALLQVVEGLGDQFGTVICDEGQLIDDESRGLSYELLLTKLQSADISRKIVFLSAILPNVDMIHEWLGGRPESLARSDYRPVQTDYAFLMPETKNTWQLIFNPIYPQPRSFFLRHFLIQNDFRYINPSTGRDRLIDGWKSYLSRACISSLKAWRNGPVAIFTTTRGKRGVGGLANRLLSMLELQMNAAKNPPELTEQQIEETKNLADYLKFLLGEDYILSRLVQFNAGFHHGRLPQEIRRVMEEGIERKIIYILICTSTLAEGVNLPIRTLVIHTVRRYDMTTENYQFIQNRSIKNIIGRAGRAGKETRGRVIFINEKERNQLEGVLKDQGMEDAKGELYRLVERINNYSIEKNIELSQILDIDHPEIIELIEKVDYSILDLLPEDVEEEAIPQLIDELIDKTLAKFQSQTGKIMECLKSLFQLRVDKINSSVSEDKRRLLKKSGAPLRFFEYIEKENLLENPIWVNLENPLDDIWIDEIIRPLLNYSSMQIENDHDTIINSLHKWIDGKAYVEIAKLKFRILHKPGPLYFNMAYHLCSN